MTFGYKRASLTDQENWWLHSYDHAWCVMMGFSHGGLDPERKWFDADLVAVAELMWRSRERVSFAGPGRNPSCERRYAECRVRWERRSFICNSFCRERIPGYQTLSDEAAYRLLGPQGLPSRRSPAMPDLPDLPDLPDSKHHSDEEIAHVTACAKLIRLYLDHGECRRQDAKAGRQVRPSLPLIATATMTGAQIEAAISAMPT